MGTLTVEVAAVQTSGISPEVAPQAEVDVLLTFATSFKSFNQSITPEVKAAAIKLKLAFNVRQGKAGTHLLVNGEEMDWKKFVKQYFGITPQRFNQILDLEEAKTIRPAKTLSVVAPEKEPDLADKFDELDRRCHELTGQVADLQGQLDDPVELCVERWREQGPEDIYGELTRIIEGLGLENRLKVRLL